MIFGVLTVILLLIKYCHFKEHMMKCDNSLLSVYDFCSDILPLSLFNPSACWSNTGIFPPWRHLRFSWGSLRTHRVVYVSLFLNVSFFKTEFDFDILNEVSEDREVVLTFVVHSSKFKVCLIFTGDDDIGFLDVSFRILLILIVVASLAVYVLVQLEVKEERTLPMTEPSREEEDGRFLLFFFSSNVFWRIRVIRLLREDVLSSSSSSCSRHLFFANYFILMKYKIYLSFSRLFWNVLPVLCRVFRGSFTYGENCTRFRSDVQEDLFFNIEEGGVLVRIEAYSWDVCDIWYC